MSRARLFVALSAALAVGGCSAILGLGDLEDRADATDAGSSEASPVSGDAMTTPDVNGMEASSGSESGASDADAGTGDAGSGDGDTARPDGCPATPVTCTLDDPGWAGTLDCCLLQ